ncbi:MAG: SRPBCC family protein [Solirubrobacteraceae bacterium]
MKSYEASATIDATPEAVWKILVDGGSYTDWDSGVVALEGDIALGQRLKVTSEANPGRAFPVRVTEVDPTRSMRWSGGMPLGLFKGERTFTLRPRGDAETEFVVREEYSGPMLGLIWRSMPDLRPSFEKFARGLKARAEHGA